MMTCSSDPQNAHRSQDLTRDTQFWTGEQNSVSHEVIFPQSKEVSTPVVPEAFTTEAAATRQESRNLPDPVASTDTADCCVATVEGPLAGSPAPKTEADEQQDPEDEAGQGSCRRGNSNVVVLDWLGPYTIYNCLDDLESTEQVFEFLLSAEIDESLKGAIVWHCPPIKEGQSFKGLLQGVDCVSADGPNGSSGGVPVGGGGEGKTAGGVVGNDGSRDPGEERVAVDTKKEKNHRGFQPANRLLPRTSTGEGTAAPPNQSTEGFSGAGGAGSSTRPGEVEGVQEEGDFQSLSVECGPHGPEYALPSTALRGLGSLKEFTLSCDGMVEPLPPGLLIPSRGTLSKFVIEDTALTSLPETLFRGCSLLDLMQLSGNEFRVLPPNVFRSLSNLTYLDLSGNSLSSIDSVSFEDNKLLSDLDLSDNLITSISDWSFQHLESLQSLTLASNRITDLSRKTFHGLTQLRTVILKNNLIKELPGDVFGDVLNTLRTVNLESNLLEQVHPNLLAYAAWNQPRPDTKSSLINVYLNHNSLTSLPGTLFRETTQLLYLFLEHNNFSWIPGDVFSGLDRLIELNISHNQLSNLQQGLFSDCLNLNHLDLSFNQIEELPSGIFKSQHKMSMLKLQNNFISQLNEGLIDISPISLDRVNLENNCIKEVSEISLKPFRKVRELFIGDNSLGSFSDEEGADGSTLAEGAFKNFTYLQYLDISRNHLVWLRINVFQDLKKLQRLDAYGNRLKSLSAFPSSLLVLDLSMNRLFNISIKEHFQGLGNLRLLNLSHNILEHLNLHDWEELPLLDRLELQYNNLSWIGPLKRVIGTWNIMYLDLSNNKLTLREDRNSGPAQIKSDYNPRTSQEHRGEATNIIARMSPLSHLKNLRTLILSNNNISDMFLDWKWDMEDLKFLDLRGNNLVRLMASDLLFASPTIQIDLRDNDVEAVILPEIYLKDPDFILCTSDRNLKEPKSSYEENKNIKYGSKIFKVIKKKQTGAEAPHSMKRCIGREPKKPMGRRNAGQQNTSPFKRMESSKKINPGEDLIWDYYEHVPEHTTKRIATTTPIKTDVELVLDGNPLVCGCHIFPLLKYIAGEVVLRRNKFHAAIITSSKERPIKCKKPDSVAGKSLEETEGWMYHLLPLIALCEKG